MAKTRKKSVQKRAFSDTKCAKNVLWAYRKCFFRLARRSRRELLVRVQMEVRRGKNRLRYLQIRTQVYPALFGQFGL